MKRESGRRIMVRGFGIWVFDFFLIRRFFCLTRDERLIGGLDSCEVLISYNVE